MIDQVSFKTKIENVSEDGTVTMKVMLTGVTLKVIGDSTAVIFSTIDSSLNKNTRSKEYAHVFKYLNDTPFTAEVSPNGTVKSISGKIEEKIQKVKDLIPEEKVNGKSITFFTNQILSKSYLKNALSVGWVHRNGEDIQQGTVQKEIIETPPIPGDAYADSVSFKPIKIERVNDGSSPMYLLKSKAGFGSNLDIGQAAIQVYAKKNMLRSAVIEINDMSKGISFKMKYQRKKNTPSTDSIY